MRAFFLAFAAACAAFLTAAPASAQDPRQFSRCANSENALPAADAIAACTALLDTRRLDPTLRVYFLALRAIHYRNSGDFARAIADYSESIALTPRALASVTDPQVRTDLAESLVMTHYGRGVSYAGLGDYRRAVPDLREALRLGPNDETAPSSANALCFALAVLGESLDEARAACDTALRSSPDEAAYLDSRGLVGLRQGRNQDAWNDYDAAVRRDGSCAHCRYGRGIAALRLGRAEEGRADLAAAEAMDAGIARTFAGYGVTP